MIDHFISFLQVASDNVTSTILTNPIVTDKIQQAVSQDNNAITAAVVTSLTAAGGLLAKHLSDRKKREDTLVTASEIDKMQMQELADNYNDFAQQAAIMEDLLRLIIQNPDARFSDILNIMVDDVTKDTMGKRLVTFYQSIQKYNQEYYKNTAFKNNNMIYNSNNPLHNVKNMVRDMSTPNPT